MIEMRRLSISLVLALGVASGACASDEVSSKRLSINAWCEATVIGTGTVDVETDYIPNVVNCENGAASFEALKAQAIAARSYLYYRLNRTGDINDGTSDQVYSCSRSPGVDHMRAAEETAGQVLMYQGTQVAAFYVAGSKQDPPNCMGGTDDPTNTERYVTYNSGLSGDNIEQTTLGLVNPANHANRGCKSQNGADCLSDMGWTHQQIINFYYGEDIELVTAEGPCVPTNDEPDAGGGTNPGTDAGDGTDPDRGVDGGCQLGRGQGGGAAGTLAVLIAALVAGRMRRR